VQPDLAAIGIRTTLDSGDWATRQTKAAEGRYDIAVAGSAGVVNDPSFLVNFVTGPAANNRSFGFDDPQLDALLQKGLEASTDADRKAVYNQVQERILTTVPFASLVGRAQAFADSKKLTGFANIPGFLTFESGYTLVGAQLQA
jgi:ABC-type transport system substrate-binding protein